jgi:hypothetical protein
VLQLCYTNLDDLRGSKGKTAVHIWIKEAIVDIPEGAQVYEGEPRDD